MWERLLSVLGPRAPGGKAVGEGSREWWALRPREALHQCGARGQRVTEWVTERGAEGPVAKGQRVPCRPEVSSGDHTGEGSCPQSSCFLGLGSLDPPGRSCLCQRGSSLGQEQNLPEPSTASGQRRGYLVSQRGLSHSIREEWPVRTPRPLMPRASVAFPQWLSELWPSVVASSVRSQPFSWLWRLLGFQ